VDAEAEPVRNALAHTRPLTETQRTQFQLCAPYIAGLAKKLVALAGWAPDANRPDTKSEAPEPLDSGASSVVAGAGFEPATFGL
jgi:hypothetical protein